MQKSEKKLKNNTNYITNKPKTNIKWLNQKQNIKFTIPEKINFDDQTIDKPLINNHKYDNEFKINDINFDNLNLIEKEFPISSYYYTKQEKIKKNIIELKNNNFNEDKLLNDRKELELIDFNL